jgi:hypothetical protein
VKRLAPLATLLLLTACGLPLGDGVQVPKQVAAGQQQRGDIQVLPPGPRPDNTPEQVVRGFFGAQSNPEDGHASARAFLTPERQRTWKDAGQVSVFDSALSIEAAPDEPQAFVVSGRRVGLIDADGSYTRKNDRISVRVRLQRDVRRGWELADVPDGLLLSVTDRDRSFRALSVYFLAPASAPNAAPHLVPDPVFVPITADPAQALVQRLLRGPSRQLDDSVETAVPDDTTLLRPVSTDGAGVVTVDLSKQVAEAPQEQKEQLSAQLVWTLREVQSAFSRLRMRSNGEDVRIAGADDDGRLQDRNDWLSYDPDAQVARAAAYYISGRRLRGLDAPLPPGPGSGLDAQPVDVAAASPRGGTVALLTDEGPQWVLRTGPLNGPKTVRRRAASLLSPSWGSGEAGVWLVDGRRLVLVPLSGAAVGVPVDGISGYGPISGVRVSRDGVRVALIAGVGSARQLVVGRLSSHAGKLRVVALHAPAPGVTDVRDVTWENATSLVVLGRLGVLPLLPVRVAVDGSSVAPLIRVGLDNSELVSLSGAPGRQLIVAALSGRTAWLFRETGRLYRRDTRGYAPFYPG